jgi:hypothetical protein
MMPEPTTVARRKAVPRNSAPSLCVKLACCIAQAALSEVLRPISSSFF